MIPNQTKSLWQLYPKRVDIILLIFISAGLFFIGLRIPVLTVQKLWETNTFSIMTGIRNLWEEKNHVLAGVIFFFSIVFPVVKLGTLLVVWFVRMTDRRRKWILYGLEILGRWSMLDVFVVAIIIVSVKLGILATAKVESGIYYFAAAILLAMAATTLESYLARRSNSRQI
jgi:paraquat-inducible protein A